MIHNDVKVAVENGDISSLKYFFCDSLDGDPTFSEYEEDYEYCKSKKVLFVPHSELHPMNCNLVTEEYWVQLKKDFMQNPSIERMEHMKKVAKILYSSRIRKIEESNARKNASKAITKPAQASSTQHNSSPQKPVSQPQVQAVSPKRTLNEPVKQSEGIRRASEPVRTTADAVRKESKTTGGDGIRRVSEPVRTKPNSNGTQQKKSNGVGCIVIIAAIAVLIIAIVVIWQISK